MVQSLLYSGLDQRERLRPNKEKAECMKYTGVLVFLLEDEEFEYFDANLIVFTCSYQE